MRRLLLPLGLAACAAPLAPTTSSPITPPPVVLIGDSITSQFGPDLTQWFGPDAATWVNAGVGGETSFNVLARVNRDVPDGTAVCVVLVGINDLLGGAGSGTDHEDVVPPGTAINGYSSVGGNIAQIVTSLRARRITPVLATVLPLTASSTVSDPSQPTEKVRTLDAWLIAYAEHERVPLLHYDARFRRADGFGDPALYNADGLHPNDAGRAVMASVATPVLRELGVLPDSSR